jgi:hypothetical protein
MSALAEAVVLNYQPQGIAFAPHVEQRGASAQPMQAMSSRGEIKGTERIEVSTEYSNELPALGRDTVYL